MNPKNIKKLATALLIAAFGCTAHAESIIGRIEFQSFDNEPSVGFLRLDTGLVEFGFDSADGITSATEYRVQADYLIYDFGSINGRFDGDFDLIISEDGRFGTHGSIIDVNLPGVPSTTIEVFGTSDWFIETLDPTESVFRASGGFSIQSAANPSIAFGASLRWLSVPEPSSLFCLGAGLVVAMSICRNR